MGKAGLSLDYADCTAEYFPYNSEYRLVDVQLDQYVIFVKGSPIVEYWHLPNGSFVCCRFLLSAIVKETFSCRGFFLLLEDLLEEQHPCGLFC